MTDRPAQHDLDRTVQQAVRGDGEAWARLVGAYTRRVYGLLVRQCGDRDLAEELTQATFVKLVTALNGGEAGGYEERGRFEAWLFRVAMNGLRDEMRRRRRQARTMDMSPGAGSGRTDEAMDWAAAQQGVRQGGPTPTEDPLAALDKAEQLERLRAAVETMSEADRQVLHLRHTAGLSFAQIAETLDQPLGTVLARGHRALAKLRKLLAEQDERTAASKDGPMAKPA